MKATMKEENRYLEKYYLRVNFSCVFEKLFFSFSYSKVKSIIHQYRLAGTARSSRDVSSAQLQRCEWHITYYSNSITE